MASIRFVFWIAVLLSLANASAAESQQRSTSPEQRVRENEVVVVARRHGQADVETETEIGEDEIAGQSADSIGTLLDRLRPLIDGTGEELVVLVNGRPVGFDRSLLTYPPEALDRIAVLRADAASQYGEPADRRVVNLVLKQRFTSIDAEAGLFAPTRGGQAGGLASARRVAISGDTRWNVSSRVELQSALSRAARDLPPRPGAPDDVDSDAFETLLPTRRNLTMAAGATRPVGSFSASLAVDAGAMDSNGLRGLAPLADTGAGFRVLRNNLRSRSLGVAATITGRPGGWQTSLATRYARSWSQSLLETASVEDDGELPFRSLNTRSDNENMTARLTANKGLLDLPAGPLTLNQSVDVQQNRSSTRRSNDSIGPPAIETRTRNQLDGRLSLNLPISRSQAGIRFIPGELAIQISAGARTQSGSGARTELAGAAIWSPVPMLQLRASFDRQGTLPTIEQIDGPLLTTINRVFDFARQETLDVVRLTGGNPRLPGGSRSLTSLSARLTPLGDQRITLTSNYRRQVADGGVLAFPELTPVVEQAFPERVTRDSEGRLLIVDARPISLASDVNAVLLSSIALRTQPRSSASDEWTASVALSHRWRLEDRLTVKAGVPEIDRLLDGGQARHVFSAQANASKSGFGINASVTWSDGATLRTGTTELVSRLAVQEPLLVDLEITVRPHPPGGRRGRASLFNNVTFSLSVSNLLDTSRRVLDANGLDSPGYHRDELDPVGRSVRFIMRKRF